MERLAQRKFLVAAERVCAAGISRARGVHGVVRTRGIIGEGEQGSLRHPALHGKGQRSRAAGLRKAGPEADPLSGFREVVEVTSTAATNLRERVVHSVFEFVRLKGLAEHAIDRQRAAVKRRNGEGK